MELFTLDRTYRKQNVIDEFESVIWTERYYGDSEFELVVPAIDKILQSLPLGILLGLTGSDELMILETLDIQDQKVTLKGISLLSWLNNRFVRVSNIHKDNNWYLASMPPGQILWTMVSQMCTESSPYLSGGIPIDIPSGYLSRLIIPDLGLRECDSSGASVSVVVPFGPLYDAMKDIAITYEIGMHILFTTNPDAEHPLGFRSYRGLDRTSTQSANSIVRFSPYLESLTNIKELQSIAGSKHLVFAFASEVDDSLERAGIAQTSGAEGNSGFDLRAEEVFVDVFADQPDANIIGFLNAQAKKELDNKRIVKAVDGEVVPSQMFQYGVHYNLGDIVEIQGTSGVISRARVTEHIHSQSAQGERAYPTVDIIN